LKWEFVSFLDPNENTSPLEKVIRLLGECVYNGGYNVASEILSFLSPAHLPIQITPTRWKSHLSEVERKKEKKEKKKMEEEKEKEKKEKKEEEKEMKEKKEEEKKKKKKDKKKKKKKKEEKKK